MLRNNYFFRCIGEAVDSAAHTPQLFVRCPIPWERVPSSFAQFPCVGVCFQNTQVGRSQRHSSAYCLVLSLACLVRPRRTPSTSSGDVCKLQVQTSSIFLNSFLTRPTSICLSVPDWISMETVCSHPEYGLRCQQGVKPPFTHSLKKYGDCMFSSWIWS